MEQFHTDKWRPFIPTIQSRGLPALAELSSVSLLIQKRGSRLKRSQLYAPTPWISGTLTHQRKRIRVLGAQGLCWALKIWQAKLKLTLQQRTAEHEQCVDNYLASVGSWIKVEIKAPAQFTMGMERTYHSGPTQSFLLSIKVQVVLLCCCISLKLCWLHCKWMLQIYDLYYKLSQWIFF